MQIFPLTSTLLRSSPRVAVALLIGMAVNGTGCEGCGVPDLPEHGLYIHCNGTPDGLYYTHYILGEIREFYLPCLGPESFHDTGGTGNGEIDLAEWTNDPDNINLLRSMCVAACKSNDANGGPECDRKDALWQVENYAGKVVPDPLLEIGDPWHRTCELPKANLASQPWKTAVIPIGSSPIWPSNGQAIAVGCVDFGTCAKEFVAPINTVLYYDDTVVPWRADMGYADYLATTSNGASTLKVTIANSGGTARSDAHDVDGRFEYSALDCGKATCPFYLANMTLSNTHDTWVLYSEDLGDEVYISNIALQLRRPTLGVWETSTGEFYLGEERIDMYVLGTVQIGAGAPIEGAYLVTNVDAVFGNIDTGSEIKILGFVADDGGNFVIEADLVYDELAGHPPTADHGVTSPVTAPYIAGLPISTLTDLSSDPDNDIDSKHWFVDGVEQLPSYVIPPGTHTIGLWVLDGRQAVDVHETTVVVLAQ